MGKITDFFRGKPQEEQQLQNMQQPQEPKSGLQMRAEQEMAMLQQHQKYKQMKANEKPKIDAEACRRATQILRKYKEGKANLEQKIIANEEFWKLRQWNYMDDGKKEYKPATAWLWSCILSRHSDAMDSFPTCNFLPRQEDDKEEAKKLSSIVPIILEQNDFEDEYNDANYYFFKQGVVGYGVFWDGSKHNGLGDVSVKKIDILSLFWQPGITDIQDSQNVFTTELVDNNILEQKYPQCVGQLGKKPILPAKYLYDDNVDTTDKSVVIDWYYHTYYNGKKTLQYAKFVGDIVLYATENETQRPEAQQMDPETGLPIIVPMGESMAERGLYDHAKFPFVVIPLYPVEGTICGMGLTDIAKDTQIQIDKLNNAIVKNAIGGATPRYFIKNDGSVNEEEYADITNDFIHVEGNIGEENIRPVDSMNLDSIYVNILQMKQDEIKFICSNQDANNGVAPSGITAASAIAALQETAGKNSRNSNKAIHRGYRKICLMIVELIRQFYDTPRTFRILSDTMQMEFMQYDNSGLKPQQQFNMLGEQMGLRTPEFDIEITTEKANPYKSMEMNELALTLYGQQFFNPQMTDQALAALDIMDFKKKEEVMQKIRENGTMQELLIMYQQLALQLAQKISPQMGEQVANQILGMQGQPTQQPMMMGVEANLDQSKEEHPYVERARNEARQSTQAE